MAFTPWYVECVINGGPAMGGEMTQFAKLEQACSELLPQEDRASLVSFFSFKINSIRASTKLEIPAAGNGPATGDGAAALGTGTTS